MVRASNVLPFLGAEDAPSQACCYAEIPKLDGRGSTLAFAQCHPVTLSASTCHGPVAPCKATTTSRLERPVEHTTVCEHELSVHAPSNCTASLTSFPLEASSKQKRSADLKPLLKNTGTVLSVAAGTLNTSITSTASKSVKPGPGEVPRVETHYHWATSSGSPDMLADSI